MNWDNISDYIVPIVSCLVLLLTAIAGVYKYIRSKNIEYYEKMLNGVYGPLYQFLVRQNTICSYIESLKQDNVSILTDVYTITNKDGQTTRIDLGDLSHDTFTSIRRNINVSIAPSGLLILINEFDALLSVRDYYNKFGNNNSNKAKFSSYRSFVEDELISEIENGYLKYLILYKYSIFTRYLNKSKEKKKIFDGISNW